MESEIDRRNLMELVITEKLTLIQLKEKIQEILEETSTVTRVSNLSSI